MSRYIEAFKTLEEEFGAYFHLTEDVLLVEEIAPQEIKTKSGVIIAANLDLHGRNAEGIEATRAHYVRIIKTGTLDGKCVYPADDGIRTRAAVQVGDVITIGPNSVLWFSTLFNTVACKPRIGLTRASEALSVFIGDTYDRIGARFKELTETKE